MTKFKFSVGDLIGYEDNNPKSNMLVMRATNTSAFVTYTSSIEYKTHEKHEGKKYVEFEVDKENLIHIRDYINYVLENNWVE